MKKKYIAGIALLMTAGLLVSCSKTSSLNSGTGNDSTGLYGSNSSGSVSTLAGNGNVGYVDGVDSLAQFNSPIAVAVDTAENVYVVDLQNYAIRKITPTGQVSTLAGNGNEGYINGPGTTAEFQSPNGIAVDAQGNVYVSEGTGDDDNRIRKITPAGLVSTFAGKGKFGFEDGLAANSKFFNPGGLAFDVQGNLYIADEYNNRIREITATGVVSTVAGNGIQGSFDGQGDSSEFSVPTDVTVDANGNVYVADYDDSRIRKISSSSVVSTLAGSDNTGTQNGTGAAARFVSPVAVAVDGQGNVYETDGINNSSIRKITPAGVVTTLTGSVNGGFMDGPLSKALFSSPSGLAIDKKGNIYVADEVNNRIRKITLN
jgi:serine/threonine-protein kinase